MRKLSRILLLLPLLCCSCQYFTQQVPNQEALLQKELKAIRWDQVDDMPSFSQCDSLTGKPQKQACFFNYLAEVIQQKLSADTLSVLYPQIDTIPVKVTVFPNSTLQFEPQLKHSSSYNAAKIDSIIKARLVDFPKINPALKHGIPVKTQFVLPVILKVE